MRVSLAALSVVVASALLLAASSASAQSTSRPEVSGGYLLLHISDETHPAGWYGDLALPVVKYLDVVGRVQGTYYTREARFGNEGYVFDITGHARVHSFMGGARLTDDNRFRLREYFEVLAGVTRTSIDATSTVSIPGSSTPRVEDVHQAYNWTLLQYGGGIHLRLSGRSALRVAAHGQRLFGEELNDASAFVFSAGLTVGL